MPRGDTPAAPPRPTSNPSRSAERRPPQFFRARNALNCCAWARTRAACRMRRLRPRRSLSRASGHAARSIPTRLVDPSAFHGQSIRRPVSRGDRVPMRSPSLPPPTSLPRSSAEATRSTAAPGRAAGPTHSPISSRQAGFGGNDPGRSVRRMKSANPFRPATLKAERKPVHTSDTVYCCS